MATMKRGEGDIIGWKESQKSRKPLQEGRRVQASGIGEQQSTLSPDPEVKTMWENKLLPPQGGLQWCTESQGTAGFHLR